jgi:hypothetical protein
MRHNKRVNVAKSTFVVAKMGKLFFGRPLSIKAFLTPKRLTI